MGSRNLVDKAIGVLQTLTNITPASSVAENSVGRLGFLPIGNYKGAPAFVDLNLLVEQPLVSAEQLHILGIMDGATEDTDLQTITVAANAIAGSSVRQKITVPPGELWLVTAVVMTCLADATGTIVANWRCSQFPDANSDVDGSLFHTANLATPLGPQMDEFGTITQIWALTNKPVILRVPAGGTITGILANAAGAANATGVTGTMQIYGYKGKPLVT